VRQVWPFLIGFAAGMVVRGWNAWVAPSSGFVVDDVLVVTIAVIGRAVYLWRR